MMTVKELTPEEAERDTADDATIPAGPLSATIRRHELSVGTLLARTHKALSRGTYATRDDAIAAGVDPLKLVQIRRPLDRGGLIKALRDEPEIVHTSGPFKGRVYKRTPTGLVRVR